MQVSTQNGKTFTLKRETAADLQAANQALLDGVGRLNTGQHLVGDQVCVIHACFGVEVQAAGLAPGGELVRVYVNTDHPETFSLLSFAAYLGIPQPLVESAMEFVTVLKHGHQPFEILPLEPHHADGLNLLAHVPPPCVDNDASIVGQGGAA